MGKAKTLKKEYSRKIKISNTLRLKYKKKIIKSWSKGLTKESNLSLLQMSKTKKKKHYTPHNKGKNKYTYGPLLQTSIKLSGKNSPNWRGGVTYFPYSFNFTPSFKKQIMERDNNTCQLCKSKDNRLTVHHIDYNKQNTQKDNCITLCDKCNSKCNHHRIFWCVFWKNYLIKKYNYHTLNKYNLSFLT